jgi:hypothetical protein
VVGRISEPKRRDMTGGWRRTHNEELDNFQSSPYIRMKKKRYRKKMGV